MFNIWLGYLSNLFSFVEKTAFFDKTLRTGDVSVALERPLVYDVTKLKEEIGTNSVVEKLSLLTFID